MNHAATDTLPLTSGRRDASAPAVASFALRRRADERFDRRGDDHGRRMFARTATAGAAIKSVVEVSPSETVNRRVVSWPGMAAEAVGVTRQGRIESRFRGPVHLLALFEAGVRSDGQTFVEGLPRSALRNYGRKLIFVPAGHEYTDWQETRSLPRLAYFYFDPAALPIAPDLDFANISLAPRMFFEDAGLWDTAIKLKALIESPQASDPLYCEALGVVLTHELVRLTLGSARVEPPARGGLAAWQQRAAAAHIEEHLAEHVSLTALAELARLSPHHFCRAFKQSFGMPPHQFHIHRRIERAKILLAKPAMSVTDVGIAMGFSGTSSFTTSFRKVTGLTPTGYRRSVT